MLYRCYLILFIILLNIDPVSAQDTRYRVELLVLTHLDHDQEPLESKFLEDYSPATDFLTPPEESEAELEEQESEEEGTNAGAETEIPSEAEEPDPNALIHIEEMSEVMQEAWRRLRLSAPFRPEQYLSWEQGREEPFPTLRVHDLEAVMVVDPYAELRLELLDQALPDPTMYYRLDGTVSLKRKRFLHLELNLQLREAVWDDESLVMADIGTPETEAPLPSSFLVQNLQQSRQVKTGRMEYFDGPVLSVLAFITSIEAEGGETP